MKRRIDFLLSGNLSLSVKDTSSGCLCKYTVILPPTFYSDVRNLSKAINTSFSPERELLSEIKGFLQECRNHINSLSRRHLYVFFLHVHTNDTAHRNVFHRFHISLIPLHLSCCLQSKKKCLYFYVICIYVAPQSHTFHRLDRNSVKNKV